jgi:Outer membrane protein beta-barrel family/CarboxypepD_reg-like domain/TonB-dependent Receptor Plug Domain
MFKYIPIALLSYYIIYAKPSKFAFMRCYLYLIFICLTLVISNSNIANAQSLGKINGVVLNNNLPLEFASIALVTDTDSTKNVLSTTTDSLGKFVFNNLEENNYSLIISLIGYKSQKVKALFTKKAAVTVLNKIELLQNNNSINIVKVIGQKKAIQKTNQGFIINADANITQAGGTATDLLKNTPTLSVDADGAITMRGKAPLIFINGKVSLLSNTDLIPASSIESIEIINSASAKYNANAESGIVNIKLKKNKWNGINGAIVAGAGYGAKPRFNSSVLLNCKTKKWNVGIGYDNRFAGRSKLILGDRTNFYLPDIYSITQVRKDHRLEKMQNLRLNADYTYNDKNTFTLEAIANREGQDNYEDLNSVIYKQPVSFASNTNRNSAEIEVANALELTATYNKKFSNDKKNLEVILSSSLDFNRQNTGIQSQALNKDNTIFSAAYLDRTHNYENGNLHNLAINYTLPLGTKAIVETGYLGTIRSIDADFEAALLVNAVYVKNDATSNVYTFNEQVHAYYALYNNSIGKLDNDKWKYNFGLRAEQVNNNGHTTNNASPFVNNYLKFFPTASINYQSNDANAWKLSYGKRIKRPDLEQLNPFKDITDTLNPHSGNPYLLPEIIHALELGYNNSHTTYSLFSNAYYRYSFNAIRGYAQLQPNGANLILPINIGSAIIYGWENMLTYKPIKWYEVNASVSVFQQIINGSNNNTSFATNAFGWYGKMINNFTIQQKNKLQIIGNYNSALATAQGQRIANYFVDMGYVQKLGKGNARLGITVVDVLNTLKSGYTNSTIDFVNARESKADTRALMLTYACTFRSIFKEKLLENQFGREF